MTNAANRLHDAEILKITDAPGRLVVELVAAGSAAINVEFVGVAARSMSQWREQNIVNFIDCYENGSEDYLEFCEVNELEPHRLNASLKLFDVVESVGIQLLVLAKEMNITVVE
jgi:hypothetical protein